jgi:geranylgeranyl diphosphate synthase, type I
MSPSPSLQPLLVLVEPLRVFLKEWLSQKGQQYSSLSPQVEGAFDRVLAMTITGKTIRGALVVYTYEILAKTAARPEILRVAAAQELTQSMLLIHDDIMDQDLQRRGQPTIHAQYQKWAKDHGWREPQRVGENIGIGIGDICLFLTQELLALPQPWPTDEILKLTGQFYTEVGFGQLLDITLAAERTIPTVAQVEQMFRLKTARYSFSLPMRLGALLAGADETTHQALEELGEKLGVMLQIRDDELGSFGDSEKMGKPTGHDLREGKKTWLVAKLVEVAEVTDRTQIDQLMNQDTRTQSDAQTMLSFFTKYDVRSLAQQRMGELMKEAEELIKKLNLESEVQGTLISLAHFVKDREK